jgi:hypothetical protein
VSTYEVIIPHHFFGRELSRYYEAQSAGAAKYQYWLNFADTYGDMTFGEFVKKIKCRKVATTTQAPVPTESA